MSSPKLFFCDLDGTLLDDDGSMHPDNRAALTELTARGTRVILASGRIPVDMSKTCETLGLEGPQITMNGALVCSPVTGEIMLERRMDAATVRDHLCFAGDRDVPAVLAYPWGYRTEHLGSAVKAAFEGRLPEEVPDIEELAFSRPFKTYLLTGPNRYRHVLDEATELFAWRYGVTSGGNDVSVELLDLAANKGHAAQTLASQLGVPMSEVAAAGDSLNDVELLAACPVSIAMHEAPTFVREAATDVAPPRSEGGLAAAIAQLFAA